MTTKPTFTSAHHTNPTLTCFISTGNNKDLICVTLTPTTPHRSLLTWQRCTFVKGSALRWIKRLVSNLTFNPNLPSLKAVFCLFKASQSRALCLLLAAREKVFPVSKDWIHGDSIGTGSLCHYQTKAYHLLESGWLLLTWRQTYFSDLRPKPEPSGGNLIRLVWTYL